MQQHRKLAGLNVFTMGHVGNKYHLNTGSDTNDVRVEDVETGDVGWLAYANIF